MMLITKPNAMVKEKTTKRAFDRLQLEKESVVIVHSNWFICPPAGVSQRSGLLFLCYTFIIYFYQQVTRAPVAALSPVHDD